MIVTLTMNPALDKSTSVGQVVSEKKLRCGPMTIEAGGGGINVSKAIHELGGISEAVFPSGGYNGKLLEEILSDKQIPFKSIPVLQETREDITVTEGSTNTQFRFVLPGKSLSGDEINHVLSFISGLDPFPAFIVASGSLPPGTPDDFYGRIASVCKTKGARCIVDASGNTLRCATTEDIYVLKVSFSELSSIYGVDHLQFHKIEKAAKEIIDQGYCQIVVVSLGHNGALLLTKDEVIKVGAPIVKKLSTVGAGDSMVAGLVWMLQQESTLKEMLQFGVACGTAAIMNPGTSLFKREDALKLYEWLRQDDITAKMERNVQVGN